MNNMVFKNNYYCLIAGLPEVFLDDRKLSLSVNGFRELAQGALKKEDMKLMNLFFLPADNKQVLRLLIKWNPIPLLKQYTRYNNWKTKSPNRKILYLLT